ncbi:MAG: ATP-dependent DNA helicase [Thermoplasmata archaeon]|nr:MAG: ATP-dependent DNA helicase [Thermoplasmata archaeon]
MNLFPYKPRKNQIAIMQTIKNTLDSNRNLVFESGTGSGKTICCLTSTIEYALENNKKIIYTTRTNAQQQQVIHELRMMRDKNKEYKDKIFGVGMQGRANMCLLARNNPEFKHGTSEELSRFCSYEKKKAKSNNPKKGCTYYRNFLVDDEKTAKTIQWVKEHLPTAEEFIEYCEQEKLCPYEINKLLIRDSPLVVVPYIYVFDPIIRNMLFDWLYVSEKDIILVVDEAHNLPNYIRDLYSIQLTTYMLNNSLLETEKYGDPSIVNGRFTVSNLCKTLIEIIRDLRDTYVYGLLENSIQYENNRNIDAFLPSHEFETEILSRLSITSKTLHDIINDLIAFGEKIQEYREKEEKLPRSYLHKLGVFLDTWVNLEMNQYTKLIVDANNGKNPRVEAYCLDPSIGTNIIKEFHSSIHMSGTLEPLEEYRDSIGLDADTELVAYPSPFPMENRRIFFVKDVTTKYDEISRDKKIIDKMSSYITNICNTFPRNTMVFFPSFNIMSMFRRNSDLKNIHRCVLFEEQEMSQIALMDLVSEFKEHGSLENNGATLFSVMGGRISEGMDFPAEQLEIAVIVGIPYPKPTARQRGLQRYYDLKFRKGWEYTVEAPTARKMLQSIGRLIRNENDRGVAIILDRRAPRFKKYIKDLEETKDLLRDIKNFI